MPIESSHVVLQLDPRPVTRRRLLGSQRPLARDLVDAAARCASLIGAGATAIILIAVPFLVAPRATAAMHSALPLLLMGMSAGFVHGLGMRPRTLAWRLVFSTWLALPLMVFGWVALLARPA